MEIERETAGQEQQQIVNISPEKCGETVLLYQQLGEKAKASRTLQKQREKLFRHHHAWLAGYNINRVQYYAGLEDAFAARTTGNQRELDSWGDIRSHLEQQVNQILDNDKKNTPEPSKTIQKRRTLYRQREKWLEKHNIGRKGYYAGLNDALTARETGNQKELNSWGGISSHLESIVKSESQTERQELRPVDKKEIITWATTHPESLSREQRTFTDTESLNMHEEWEKSKKGLAITGGLTVFSLVISYVSANAVEFGAEHINILKNIDNPWIAAGMDVTAAGLYGYMWHVIGSPFRKANKGVYKRKGFSASLSSALTNKVTENFGINEKFRDRLEDVTFYIGELCQEPLFLLRTLELFQQNPSWAGVFLASSSIASIVANHLKTLGLQYFNEKELRLSTAVLQKQEAEIEKGAGVLENKLHQDHKGELT